MVRPSSLKENRMPPRLVLLAALLLPALAHGQAAVSPHAPDGGSFERIQSVVILPKPGAPFTATVVTVWTRLLEDGTTTTIKNHRTVARDSSGRIFQERRAFTPTGDKQVTYLRTRQYSDPTRHEFWDCITATRICTVYPFHAAPSVATNLAPATQLANGNVTREDLGQQTIQDLEAQGSREITTIQPGANGYKLPEPTIKEFWYSPRLEVNLITKRFEPRGGAQNLTLENISIEQPDPSLFLPPSDYKVVRTDTTE
jgi:hypothetical protein